MIVSLEYSFLHACALTNQSTDIILSLVRTTRVGYLRDVRRLTVALSRARLGLYILGRREVFESCFELREAFDRLLQREDKLQLVVGEMFDDPMQRKVDDVEGVQATEMDGVEHLGQYVFEMTRAKVESLKEGREILPEADEVVEDEEDDENEQDIVEEVDGEIEVGDEVEEV